MPITFLTNEDKTIIDKNIAQLSEEIGDLSGLFIDRNANLFDGVFVDGYISGSSGAVRINKNDVGKIVAVNVAPNTTYSIIKESIEQENGNSWFKLISFTESVESVLNSLSGGWSNHADGSVEMLMTGPDVNLLNYTFTTGNNDASVFVLVSRAIEPYVEFVKGEWTVPRFFSYDIKLVDDLKANKILVKKYTDSIVVYRMFGSRYVGYKFSEYIDININSDVWRLVDISVYDRDLNVLYTVNPYTSDTEGVIKIQGEADYVGSVHGYEQYNAVFFYVDGAEKDFSEIENCYCDSFKMVVSSVINHADSDTKAFDKIKQTEVTKHECSIINKYVCAEAMTIDRIRLTANIPKYVDGKLLVTKYGDKRITPILADVPSETTEQFDLNYSEKLRDCILTGERFNISVEVDEKLTGGNDTRGRISDFGTRLKPYFDAYMAQSVAANEVLYASYKIVIRLT